MSNDMEIIEAYSLIASAEDIEGYATHDINHVNRVINNCIAISRLLAISEDDAAAIKIAALLHDIGCVNGEKEGHAKRSAEWAKRYLQDKNMPQPDIDKIIIAVGEHSGDAKSTFGKILLFADKIDICAERILPRGLKLVGNRQYGHIMAVEIAIENEELTIDFLTDGEIDIAEMNEYYFTVKVFQGIADLARHFGLSHKIMFDGVDAIGKCVRNNRFL